MSNLLLVRHGESTWNVQGRVQGQTASPELTELGREQAMRVAVELAGAEVGRAFTSDLVRAQQTARIIGDRLGLAPVATPLLRERHYGVWQGGETAAAVVAARELGDDEPLPGGESLVDVRRRWARFVSGLAPADSDVIVITHGNVIAAVTGDPHPANGSLRTLAVAEALDVCKGLPTL